MEKEKAVEEQLSETSTLEDSGGKSNCGQEVLKQQILAMLEDGSDVVCLLKKIIGEVVEEKLKVQSESGGVLKKLFSGSSANEWKVKFEAEHREVGRLNEEVARLEKVEQNLKDDISRQKTKLEKQFAVKKIEVEKRWNDEKSNFEEKLKKLNSTIGQQGKMLEQRFSGGWDAFEAYKSLPQDVKNRFRITFSNEDDFESFVLCGAKGEVVESLWEEAKHNLDKDCFEDLCKVLESFLSLVNKTRREGKYELVRAEVGSTYDSREHQCYRASKSQGTVQRCMLPGLLKNGKIIKTSVVEVE